MWTINSTVNPSKLVRLLMRNLGAGAFIPAFFLWADLSAHDLKEVSASLGLPAVQGQSAKSFCHALLGDVTEPTLRDFERPIPSFSGRQGVAFSDYVHGGKLSYGSVPRNQFRFANCWAQNYLAVYEVRYFRATKKRVKLSANFLVISHLLEETLNAIFNGNDLENIDESANAVDASELISKYGLLPQKVWRWRVPIEKSKTVIRRLVLHLRLEAQNSLISWRHDASPENEEKIRRNVMEIFETYLGSLPPHTFRYSGQAYTPLAFAEKEEFLPPNPIPNAPGRHFLRASDVGSVSLFTAIRRQLDESGEPVILSLKWDPNFVDDKTGIASIEAFSPFAADPAMHPLIAKLSSHPRSGWHSVTVVDYALNADGSLQKLLVLNTWGRSMGARGFYHIFSDYFHLMARNAFILNGFY